MEISEKTVDNLKEIMNMGIGEASISLSESLDRFIKLTIPDVMIMSLEEMRQYASSYPPMDFVHVAQKITGELNGIGILSFPVTNGKTLVEILLEQQAKFKDAIFNSMEIEAIQEVGNMVINSVGMALADITEIRITYSFPEVLFSKDVFPFSEYSSGDINFYCISTTIFSVDDIDVTGIINLVLNHSSITIIDNILT